MGLNMVVLCIYLCEYFINCTMIKLEIVRNMLKINEYYYSEKI